MNKLQLSNLNAPCKGCTERYMKCHITCDSYNIYVNEKQKIYDRKHEKCAINDALHDVYKRKKKM